MAISRPSRNTPPYALFICIGLLLIAVVLDVWFYLGMGKAQQLAATDGSAMARYVSPSEQNNATVRALLAQARAKHNTAIGEAVSEINQLEHRIAGTTGVPVATLTGPNGTINTALKAAKMGGSSLVAAVNSLNGELAKQKAQSGNYSKTLAATRASIKRLNAQFDAQLHADNAKLAATNTILATTTAHLAKLRQQVVKQAGGFENKMTKRSAANERALRQLVVQVQQQKDLIARKQLQIADLRRLIEQYRPKGIGSTSRLYQADGKIIRASDGSKVVFINLGRRQHVMPGLTFAVYSPNQGVGGKHKKGDIQVVQVGADESEARITHVKPNQTLFSGDLISNPVFNTDRTRKLHFVVYGDFDLNGTGVPTRSSYDRVVRMIKSWGGVIDKKLSPQTDFLVLGTPPANAVSNFPVETRQTKDIEKQREKQLGKYNRLVQQATDDSVPILNANRFLALIGFHNVTMVQQ